MAAMTIKEIARISGVSIATVSRVINETSYVSPEIKQRVRKVIEESQYVPNSVARSLRSDNTWTVGSIISDIANSYFNIIAKVSLDLLREQNYSMIICSTEEDGDRELNYLRFLDGRKVDGIILNSTGKNDDYIATLSQRMPIVLLNRRIRNLNFQGDLIDSSNHEGSRLIVDHLVKHGHQKIGVINGDLNLSTGQERFEGFVEAMAQHGLSVESNYPFRFDGKFHMDEGFEGARVLCEKSQPPTAIAVMNNAMAIGAMKYFKAHRIRVPDDISLVVYGDIFNSDILYVEPDYVTLDPYIIGRKATEMILERIRQPDLPNREV
ncbi:MAG: LacI family transcriptional regulator, partial [Clostridia bacterium]|nr:LacI family transcriptional regulator [Clostridia bacterium]